MKTRHTIYLLHLLAAAILLAAAGACTGDFDEYNHNPNQTTDAELRRDNYDVGAKLQQLQNEVIPTQEHLYQFTEILAGMSYGGYAEGTKTDWASGKFSTFNPPVNWIKAPFVDVMTQTYAPYRGIRKVTDDPVPLALADLLRVAIMHRLTDQFGPIPYTKVVEDRKESLTVPYDAQQEVYTTMFAELDAAIAVLEQNRDLSTEAFGEYDQVYGGDLKKWILMANSLKLRMAMRLTEVAPQTAQAKAAEAISAGVIESNADNASFQPVLNRTAMIWNDWQDHVISADLDSYMNGYRDPRREKMFTSVVVKHTVQDPETGKEVEVAEKEWHGLRIGTTPLLKSAAVAACSFPVIGDQTPFLWITAAEVAFLKAEWQLRWGTMSQAGVLYRKGVTLSFEQWKAAGADEYLADAARKPAAYTDPLGEGYGFPAQSAVTPVWGDDDDLETALERIITQKWIALFPLGNEAWAEYRRTGYPRLMAVPAGGDKSGGTVNTRYGARRIPYPTEEYSENRANVTAAVNEHLGGRDDAGARLWWDCKTLN